MGLTTLHCFVLGPKAVVCFLLLGPRTVVRFLLLGPRTVVRFLLLGPRTAGRFLLSVQSVAESMLDSQYMKLKLLYLWGSGIQISADCTVEDVKCVNVTRFWRARWYGLCTILSVVRY